MTLAGIKLTKLTRQPFQNKNKYLLFAPLLESQPMCLGVLGSRALCGKWGSFLQWEGRQKTLARFCKVLQLGATCLSGLGVESENFVTEEILTQEMWAGPQCDPDQSSRGTDLGPHFKQGVLTLLSAAR